MDPYNGNPKDINRTNNNSAFGDIFLMAVIMVFLHSHNATNHGEREITVTVVPAVLMKIVSGGKLWGHPLKGTCQEKKIFLQ